MTTIPNTPRRTTWVNYSPKGRGMWHELVTVTNPGAPAQSRCGLVPAPGTTWATVGTEPADILCLACLRGDRRTDTPDGTVHA
jgi:hypothetical protein